MVSHLETSRTRPQGNTGNSWSGKTSYLKKFSYSSVYQEHRHSLTADMLERVHLATAFAKKEEPCVLFMMDYTMLSQRINNLYILLP